MENKIDLISKRVDLIHKKILILIAGSAGSWYYGVDFLKNKNIYLNLFGVILFLAFLFFTIGLIVNYFKLSKLDKRYEGLEDVE